MDSEHLTYAQYHLRLVVGRVLIAVGAVWTLLGLIDVVDGIFLPAVAGLSVLGIGFVVQWYAHVYLDEAFKDEYEE